MNKKVAVLLLVFFSVFFALIMPKKTHALRCGAEKPHSAPVLFSAVPADKSITLTWTPAQDPVTYYLLQYGFSKDNFEYGLPNIGGRETTSFTVNYLENGKRYYFRVRAGNDCKPGAFSHTLSAVPGTAPIAKIKIPPNLSLYKKTLGASTSAAIEEQTPTKKVNPQAPVAAAVQGRDICNSACMGGPLLIAETILLLIVFYVSKKTPFIKPGMSVFVPIFLNIFFYKSQNSCSSSNFFCMFFLPLSVILFILIVITQKFRIIQHHAHYQTT